MNIREDLFEYFPDLIFLDAPIEDSNILGISLVFDKEPTWVVTYSDSLVLSSIKKMFQDSESPFNDAIKWFEDNVESSWVGPETPMFLDTTENVATRNSVTFEDVLALDEVSSLYEATKMISKNPRSILYVPYSEVPKLALLA